MGLVCLYSNSLSRLFRHLSSHSLVQTWFLRRRLFVSVFGLKYTISNSSFLRIKYFCYQYQQKHAARKDLVYFSPHRRIPKRYVEEIENVLELHHDKIVHLASICNCDVDLIESVIRQDTRIMTSFRFEDVLEKITLVMSYGYSIYDIISYSVLFARSLDELKRRLNDMEKVRKISFILRPLVLPQSMYRTYMEQMQKEAVLIDGHPSRDSYIASLLGCSESELKCLAEKGNRHLLTKKPSQMKQLVELLLSHGVSLEEIRQNPGVLLASVHLAKRRLQQLSELGLILKEHMVFILTTSDDNVEMVIPNWIKEKEALGPHSNRKQYLMHRLSLDEHQYEMMTRRANVIKEMNARRLKQVLGVLLDEMGLVSEDIQNHPTLLFYSVERLSKRMKILQEAGVISKTHLIKELKLTEADFSEKYGDDV